MTKGKAQIIRQTRNKLKEKAMRDARAPATEEEAKSGFSNKALEDLDAAFQQAADDYPKVAQEYFEQLESAVTAYEKALAAKGDLKGPIAGIHRVAHELKGQGATFGYPLISLFGNSLYKFTKPSVPIRDSHTEILKAHTDTMRVVINQKIKGDGGAVGKELSSMLQKALAQHTNK